MILEIAKNVVDRVEKQSCDARFRWTPERVSFSWSCGRAAYIDYGDEGLDLFWTSDTENN